VKPRLKTGKMALNFHWEGERGGSVGISGWWGGGWERGRRVNTVQIMCTHVHKCKNDTC
jgi:hypothetical protein